MTENNDNELEKKLEEVSVALKQIEQQSAALKAASDKAHIINSAVSTYSQQKTAVSNTVAEINGIKETANSAYETIKKQEAESLQYNKSIASTEKKYKETINTFANFQARIETILYKAESSNDEATKILGTATTIGLSKSFKDRKSSLNRYRYLAYVAFVICLASIILILSETYLDAIPLVGTPVQQQLENSLADAFYSFLKMLPWLIAPTWGAIVFSKLGHELTKLEEFYAQKEAIAKAYVGYKDELERLSQNDDRFEELIELIKLNINTISMSSIGLIEKNPPEHPYKEVINNFLLKKSSSKKNVDDED